MNLDELRRLGNRLATGLLAKDWPDEPVYLMHSSQFGEAGRAINGFACRQSYLFRAALGESWEGPGRIIMINDSNLERVTAERGEDLEHRYLGIVVHEAAHCALMEIEPPDSDRNLVAELCFEIGRELPLGSAASMVADMNRPIQRAAIDRRGEAHGADWHRAVIHCHWRAYHHHWHLLGIDEVCYAGDAYGLSSGGDYMRALLPECRERADEPIRQIIASPAPQAFTDLWERDIAAEIAS